MTVTDTGCGFDPATADAGRTGFGLLSIQERLGYLGGQVQICSAPGKGTSVCLRIAAQLAGHESGETL